MQSRGGEGVWSVAVTAHPPQQHLLLLLLLTLHHRRLCSHGDKEANVQQMVRGLETSVNGGNCGVGIFDSGSKLKQRGRTDVNTSAWFKAQKKRQEWEDHWRQLCSYSVMMHSMTWGRMKRTMQFNLIQKPCFIYTMCMNIDRCRKTETIYWRWTDKKHEAWSQWLDLHFTDNQIVDVFVVNQTSYLIWCM